MLHDVDFSPRRTRYLNHADLLRQEAGFTGAKSVAAASEIGL